MFNRWLPGFRRVNGFSGSMYFGGIIVILVIAALFALIAFAYMKVVSQAHLASLELLWWMFPQ